MAKNKRKEADLIDRLTDKIEMQGERLRQVISQFYPDGERVAFVKASQVGKLMEGAPSLVRYSEDEPAQAKINKIRESVETSESHSIVFDFKYNTQRFRGCSSIVYDVCIMFKVAPEAAPIFVHDKDEELEEGLAPKFFVDAETKEAFLLLEDLDNRYKKSDHNNSSFTSLSEFYAIFSGYYDEANVATEDVCYITSFSQEDGRCYVEKIFDINKCLLDGLFTADTPSDGDDAVPPASDDNDAPETTDSIDNDEETPTTITETEDASPPADSEGDEMETDDDRSVNNINMEMSV